MNNLHDYFNEWQNLLSIFANEGKFKDAIFSVISNDNSNNSYIQKLDKELANSSYVSLPNIELLGLDSGVKTAAYSSKNETIYVNEDWLNQAAKVTLSKYLLKN